MPKDERLGSKYLLMILLSGAVEGSSETRRYSQLRYRIRDVLHEEEYPAPKIEDGKKIEVKPHSLIRNRYLTDITRMASKEFDEAFLNLVLSGSIESVGHGGDYLVYIDSLNRWAEKARNDSGISTSEYNYLRNVGKKINQLRRS